MLVQTNMFVQSDTLVQSGLEPGMSRHPGEDTFALIVVERGAEWPSWGRELCARATHAAVVTQLPGESKEDFERRVTERLERVARQSMRLVTAAYVCSPPDGRPRASSLRLAKRVLASVDQQGEFIVGGAKYPEKSQDESARRAVMDLWIDLTVHASGRVVSARFDELAQAAEKSRARPWSRAPSPRFATSAI